MRQDITELVTHPSPFHADEVIATAVLRRLFPDAEIIRTRREDMTAMAPGRIVYDVGGEFSAELNAFDHHQPDAPRRLDGTGYAAAGLIWERFGKDFLRAEGVPEHHVDEVWAKTERTLFIPVDRLDNGEIKTKTANEADLSSLSIPSLISKMNPTFTGTKSPDDAFLDACDFASSVVDLHVSSALARAKAFDEVLDAYNDRNHENVVVIDASGIPFQSAIQKIGDENILFAVFPRDEGWGVSGCDSRLLPEEWAGLRGKELEVVSGVEGAEFVHVKRFFGVSRTRSGAIAMAEIASDRILGVSRDASEMISPES